MEASNKMYLSAHQMIATNIIIISYYRKYRRNNNNSNTHDTLNSYYEPGAV